MPEKKKQTGYARDTGEACGSEFIRKLKNKLKLITDCVRNTGEACGNEFIRKNPKIKRRAKLVLIFFGRSPFLGLNWC